MPLKIADPPPSLERKIQLQVAKWRNALKLLEVEGKKVSKTQAKEVLRACGFNLCIEEVENWLDTGDDSHVYIAELSKQGYRLIAEALHPPGPADTGLHTPGVVSEPLAKRWTAVKGKINNMAENCQWNNAWRQELATPGSNNSFSPSATRIGGILDGHYYLEKRYLAPSPSPYSDTRPKTASYMPRQGMDPYQEWDRQTGRAAVESVLKGTYYNEGAELRLQKRKKPPKRAIVRRNILSVTRRNSKSCWKSVPQQQEGAEIEVFPSRPSTALSSLPSHRSSNVATGSEKSFSLENQPKQINEEPVFDAAKAVAQLHPVLVKKLNESWGQVNKAFKFLDVDRSGTIDIDEFEQLFLRFNIELSQEELERSFNVFDIHKQGVISYQDFNLVCASIIHTKDEGGVGLGMSGSVIDDTKFRKFDVMPSLDKNVVWNNRFRQELCQPDYGEYVNDDIPLIQGVVSHFFGNQEDEVVKPAHRPPPPPKESNRFKQEWDPSTNKSVIETCLEGAFYKEDAEGGKNSFSSHVSTSWIIARNRMRAHTALDRRQRRRDGTVDPRMLSAERACNCPRHSRKRSNPHSPYQPSRCTSMAFSSQPMTPIQEEQGEMTVTSSNGSETMRTGETFIPMKYERVPTPMVTHRPHSQQQQQQQQQQQLSQQQQQPVAMVPTKRASSAPPKLNANLLLERLGSPSIQQSRQHHLVRFLQGSENNSKATTPLKMPQSQQDLHPTSISQQQQNQPPPPSNLPGTAKQNLIHKLMNSSKLRKGLTSSNSSISSSSSGSLGSYHSPQVAGKPSNDRQFLHPASMGIPLRIRPPTAASQDMKE